MNAETRQLLEHLYRGGDWAYWWGVTGEEKVSRWWPVGKPAPVPTAEHVYFGVHPASELPQRGDSAKLRATIPDIAAVNCLFAEFDAKDFAGDKPATLAHVDGLAVPPSVIVDSGGGYHAYWLFRAPFRLTSNEERERARRLQAAWVVYVGGDKGAKDLARVLRVPGTVNRKYDPPRPVVILRADYDRLYNLPDLETLARPAERTPAPIGGNGRGPSEDAGSFWLGKALDQAAPGNRNATGFWLATQLRDAGLSASEAEGQLLAYARLVPQGDGANFYSDGEALASLREAYKTPAREPARKAGSNGTAPTAGSSPAAGKDEPPAWLGAEDQATKTPAARPRFTPFPADDLDKLPPVSWHVAGEIPRQSFGALFGPTGSGKSFFALDRALTLAQTAPVVYVAAEGAAGYAARKIAWCKVKGLGAGQLYFVGEAVNLLDMAEVTAFTDAILPLSPALVIFDTLARCMIGGDENSARDMGLLVAACDDLRAATGATVLVVHHTGKSGQAERGSSALRAACDFMLGLASDDGLITLTCEKSKDAEPFEARALRLVTFETGRPRADGTPETSCVILPSDKVLTAGFITPTGRKILDTLALETFKVTGGRASVLIEVTGLKPASFYRAASGLVRDGYARQDVKGDPYYITAKGEGAITTIKELS
jgi:hypothetical protein